jgi:hypothetical protein
MKKRIRRTPAKSTRDYRASRLHPLITLGLGLVLALFTAALTYSTPFTQEATIDGSAAFFSMQPTSTPQPQDLSEVGSTDGIVIMGILIALIIIVPILLRNKSWLENR